MFNSLRKNKHIPIKIRSMSELKMAKEMYRYEVRLQDQAFKGSSNRLKRSVGTLVKDSLRDAAQAYLIRKIVSFVKARL